MEKLCYVVWKRTEDSPSELAARMRGEVSSRLCELGVHRLSLNLVDDDVEPVLSARMTRFDPPIAGLVTFWLDNADDRAPFESAIAGATSRLAGYLVVESVPLVNTTHTVGLGERTPGVNMVACIEKPDRFSYDEWLAHWHGHHKRVALETQDSYAYVRNVVVRALTEDAPPWAGIVEEGFSAEAVTDPMLWYDAGGSKEKLEENFGRMMESVSAFLDVDRVESNPMSEYHIK